MAFEAGCHVVCEKPLCWDMGKDYDAIAADGEAVVAAADQANKALVVCAQYPAAIPIYRDFYARVQGQWDQIESIEMEMEAKGRKGAKTREDIWIDLASHPLSLLIGLLPDGEVDWAQASCTIGERENRAVFDVKTPKGICGVQVVLRDIDDGVPLRRFGVNGFLVGWEGFADACGIYRARLTHGDETVVCNDFMHILIDEFGQFVRGEGGRVVVSGEEALKNLKYQVALLKHANRPQ
jgi:predicted dehydrogenase